MSDWIEHTGDCDPLPKGTLCQVRYRDGEVSEIAPSGQYDDVETSAWVWIGDRNDIVAYRLHDDGQSEAETRKARMDQFYKIAAGKEHIIEETMKPKEKAK